MVELLGAKSLFLTRPAMMQYTATRDELLATAGEMINEAHIRGGRIRSFISYCGGLPSPEAANNPLAYKFSWNPAGAIRAGRNSATYKYHGEIVQVDGNSLYDSAIKLRLPDLPAFALECLPNRNSLIYGDLYGFGAIMGTLARIGFFDTEIYSFLSNEKRPTYRKLLLELLKLESEVS